ncbi:nucleotide-binding universal stress UspA family protein [Sphingomicrobium lutaoense]|uniref:Nucleotide-binding universal stress UspA family protein n=1 Tax=Sphingomicrobium lutaoense TaxID=515949 RepID=A0A839YZK9_9SPHN|nr:nucleotide-binding universal stress UspA family protein [Sphingomicrobium lutaoense]
MKLGEKWNAEVVLVHALGHAVTEPPPQNILDERMRSVLPQQNNGIRFRYPRQCAADGVISVAQEEDARLIVLGLARSRGVKEFLLGTVVEHVICRSPVPVLVAKNRATRCYANVACATDFHPPSLEAFKKAMGLFDDADFQLIHAFEVPFERWQNRETARHGAAKFYKGLFEKILNELSSDARKRVTTQLVYGGAGTVLQNDILNSGADLLVLGNQGESRLRRAIIGSTANSLLRALPIDMLVIGEPN